MAWRGSALSSDETTSLIRMRACRSEHQSNRRLPGTIQRFAGLSLGPRTNRSAWSGFIPVAYSREPLVFASCERIWRWNKFGGSFGAAPKRLPSPLAHPKRLPLEPQSVVSGIVMATYIYETVPDSVDIPSRRFEVRQSMLDAPLTHDPETGQPVRRVISGGFGLMTGSKNAPSSGSSSSSCGSGHCGCC
jgi:predicted nucleic acid-binding Zn ribbon protein